jgi:hypothetical protein
MYWWGVSANTVTLWRKALGVEGWTGTEGTRRLVQAAQARAVDQLRGKCLPPEQVERRRQTARALNLAQYLEPGHGAGWTAGQLALVDIHRDDRGAALTDRSENAVRVKRCKLGIPNPSGPGWTAEELDLLGRAPDGEVAARIGRSEGAVTMKRCRLSIPTFCDRRRAGHAGE